MNTDSNDPQLNEKNSSDPRSLMMQNLSAFKEITGGAFEVIKKSNGIKPAPIALAALSLSALIILVKTENTPHIAYYTLISVTLICALLLRWRDKNDD